MATYDFEATACTHCGATNVDMVDGSGNPWHARCYQAWRAEYTAYLDELHEYTPKKPYRTPKQRAILNGTVFQKPACLIANGIRDLFPTKPQIQRPRWMK